jgi:hypothetical protein
MHLQISSFKSLCSLYYDYSFSCFLCTFFIRSFRKSLAHIYMSHLSQNNVRQNNE